jgi:hypothetical protein
MFESSISKSFAEERLGRSRQLFPSRGIYSILNLAMTKRKPEQFSATKAVKANARERVGQPKPTRVVAEKPKSGRKAKHKERLDEILRREE